MPVRKNSRLGQRDLPYLSGEGLKTVSAQYGISGRGNLYYMRNGFLLLIPFLLIRFGLLSYLNKDAVNRAAHWIILAEERWCVESFGESYREYMGSVRRYI